MCEPTRFPITSFYRRITIVFSAVLFAGCERVPTDEEIRSADRGNPVDSADYGNPVDVGECVRLAQEFIASRMKDPGSAQFSNVICYKGWKVIQPTEGGPSIAYGYPFEGNVNAKNSFGGYVGFTPFRGIVRDDGIGPRVTRYCIVEASEYRMCALQMVR